MQKIKVLSLFDGISCARAAVERAGFSVEKYYASEIDENAIFLSKKNWSDVEHVGDVRKVTGERYKNIDLLIGGSPCQDLSKANTTGKGLAGKRSGLFYEYLRILRETKPRWFILENVASMKQIYRDEITRELGVEPIMIDAGLVSAQTRRRYFWTNIKGVTLPEDRGIVLKDILEAGVPVTPLDRKIRGRISGWKENERKVYAFKKEAKSAQLSELTFAKVDAKSGTLTTHRAPNIFISLEDGTLAVREATKKGYAIAHDGDAIDVSFPNSTTRRGRVGKKAKSLMTTSHISVFTQGGGPTAHEKRMRAPAVFARWIYRWRLSFSCDLRSWQRLQCGRHRAHLIFCTP